MRIKIKLTFNFNSANRFAPCAMRHAINSIRAAHYAQCAMRYASQLLHCSNNIAKILSIFLCFHLAPTVTHASEQARIYIQQGNQFYEEGNFTEARAYYEKALNEGLVNLELYYNYGNTLFRLDKLGEAIIYYEKALKLSPTDEDIKANLKFANAQTIDKYPQPEYNAITRFIWYLHSSYGLNTSLWLILGIFCGIFLMGTLLLFLPPGSKIIIYPLMAILLLCLLIITPSIALRINEQETVRFAVVLSPTLEIYSGPGESYQVLSKVHEGTKFKIEKISGNWAKVKLPNGTGGFVKYTELGKI